MQLVSTVTVGAGGAASIEFTSIPQTGTDLVLVLSARNVRAAFWNTLGIRVNGAIATGRYVSRRLIGAGGSGVASATSTSDSAFFGGISPASDTTANTFGNSQFYFPNYANTTTNKTVSMDSVAENNGSQGYNGLSAAIINSTAAITSLMVLSPDGAGNFVQNSTASLYIITKA